MRCAISRALGAACAAIALFVAACRSAEQQSTPTSEAAPRAEDVPASPRARADATATTTTTTTTTTKMARVVTSMSRIAGEGIDGGRSVGATIGLGGKEWAIGPLRSDDYG